MLSVSLRDHLKLINIGTKTHLQIEGHIQGIGNYAFPMADGSANQIIETDGLGMLSWVNKTEGFVCGDLNTCSLNNIGTRPHSQLTDIGTNTHAQIDTHIADSTIHFTEAVISHLNIADIGTNTHAQVDTHIADNAIHFTEGSISHLNIADIGTNTHAQIDTHITANPNGAAQGQLKFWDAALSRWVHTETSELFWDDTNKRIGIGTNNPNNLFQVADLISFTNADFRTQIGYQAGKYDLGQYNTWIGYNAGSADNAVGKTNAADHNVAVGYSALSCNTTGTYNTALGSSALRVNTVGSYNLALGGYTLRYNTTGASNTAVSPNALRLNVSGNYNLALGASALYYNVGGNSNVALGGSALRSNTNGDVNTALGASALRSNTVGSYNLALGGSALYNNITGSNSIAVGRDAGYYETASNKLFIDNASRANQADGRIKALIYGVFAATIANQLLRINGILELTSIKSGATQVGAGAAINEVWKTNGHATLPNNILMIGV